MLQDLGDFQFWKMTPLAIVRKMSSGFLYLVGMVTWVMSPQKQSYGNNGILHMRSTLHSCRNGGCAFRIAVSGPYINIFGYSFEGLFHPNTTTTTWLHFCSWFLMIVKKKFRFVPHNSFLINTPTELNYSLYYNTLPRVHSSTQHEVYHFEFFSHFWHVFILLCTPASRLT